MLLKEKQSGDLIEIKNITELVNPSHNTVTAQSQSGQNEQPPQDFKKEDLIFPSGEDLPLCWLDADYRDRQ